MIGVRPAILHYIKLQNCKPLRPHGPHRPRGGGSGTYENTSLELTLTNALRCNVHGGLEVAEKASACICRLHRHGEEVDFCFSPEY